MWACLAVVCALLLYAAEASQTLPKIRLVQGSDGTRRFVESDSQREVMFHGVNAIVKGIPWHPSTSSWDMDVSLTTKDFETLQSLGINLIRLGVMWPGVEPVRGQYNMTYLQELETIVKNAADYGIYTLLDMHQDVLSEKYCGEGIPGWAAVNTADITAEKGFATPQSSSPFTDVASDGFPTRQDCAKFGWASYYSTYAASNAFESLYTNVDGLLEAWGGFWKVVATKFSGMPSVIGYELINEPWAGDVFKEPKRLVPSVADREVLQPAYDYLANAIREVDSNALVFFAAVTWDDPIPAGFSQAPGGPEYADRSVFAYHFYKPPQFTLQHYFKTRTNDAKRLQTASFLTEFERPNVDGAITEDPFVDAANTADEFLQSWAMWEMKAFCKETEESLNSDSQQAAYGSCKTGYGERLIWNDAGDLNVLACQKLSRSYPLKVVGTLTHFHFNATSGNVAMQWEIDSTITEPSAVFVNFALNYPNGVKVSHIPKTGIVTKIEKETNQVIVSIRKDADIKSGDKIELRVERV